jgi:hypothetical protein
MTMPMAHNKKANGRETYRYNAEDVCIEFIHMFIIYNNLICRKKFWRMHFATLNTLQNHSGLILKRKPGSPISRLKFGSRTGE